MKKESTVSITKRERNWNIRYQQLKECFEQQQYNVLQKYKENPELVNWVNTQRRYHKKGKLSQEKINLLNQLDFDWGIQEDLWNIRYRQLKEYREQYQNCNVPQKYKENPSLGKWVDNQRQHYKKNKLSQDKIKLLEELNFDWDPVETRWQDMYQQLREYFEQHNHSNVPIKYKENPQLGTWVSEQRRNYKANKLPQEKINLLENLNFDWDTVETKWNRMYQQLQEYFEQYQHCNVPQRFKENPSLGSWINNQRQAYKNNELSQERIELLNQLNFDWRN